MPTENLNSGELIIPDQSIKIVDAKPKNTEGSRDPEHNTPSQPFIPPGGSDMESVDDNETLVDARSMNPLRRGANVNVNVVNIPNWTNNSEEGHSSSEGEEDSYVDMDESEDGPLPKIHESHSHTREAGEGGGGKAASHSGHGERPSQRTNRSYANVLQKTGSRSQVGSGSRGNPSQAVSKFIEDYDIPTRDYPGGYPHQQEVRTTSAGLIFGTVNNIATSIQSTLMPTPQQRIQQLKDELHRAHIAVAEARSTTDNYARELKRSRQEFRQAVAYINNIEHDRQRLREANSSYEHEMAIVRRELDDAKNLAAIRGKELVGSQVFLTKADNLSISEVIDKVNNLNEEIFQAAAHLGESLVFKREEHSPDDLAGARRVAEDLLGSKLVGTLIEQASKPDPEANPLVVQVTLQVFLVSHCSTLVQSWYPNDPTYASFLSAIYSKIRDTEEQAVTGRWRALTRTHTRQTFEGWNQQLLYKLGCILRVASWMTPSINERHAFEQKLEPIFKAVEDLRLALGEKFTSADLEVSIMNPSQVFQPTYMEDAYGDASKSAIPPGPGSREFVVGTTGIGLKQAVKERSKSGDVLFKNVVSAKVALESTLLEALQPPVPRRTRKPPKPTPPTGKETARELPAVPKTSGSSKSSSGQSNSSSKNRTGTPSESKAAADAAKRAAAAEETTSGCKGSSNPKPALPISPDQNRNAKRQNSQLEEVAGTGGNTTAGQTSDNANKDDGGIDATTTPSTPAP